ncbi:unnamed protein product [Microthlaspi erraticum]|uniref:FBD domain-containing protein n=1 Tax=Microthlaspi erraticum TaxID=1685480 RepID=A0A6D2LM52_9BRAS|nr:unnamed protein product [Microthlaspi erraticum]
MVLSKRWKFLWTFVPRLEYDHAGYEDGEDWIFSRFFYSSLLLHEAPVLESLSFMLHPKTGGIDIGVCVRTAIKRSVRKLHIVIDDCSDETIHPAVILPSSLYTGCRMLVTLGLSNLDLMDSSSTVCFPSLKTLALTWINYPNSGFVPMFLSGCPVLENLFVQRCFGDNGGLFVIKMACLKVLSYRKISDFDADGFWIDAPSLELLNVDDQKLVGSIASMNPMPSWNEPSDVPRCLLSSLETFEWSQYEGREDDIQVARFILRNSARLKTAAFNPKSTDPEEKLEILTKLSMTLRSSTTCQLNFGLGTSTSVQEGTTESLWRLEFPVRRSEKETFLMAHVSYETK